MICPNCGRNIPDGTVCPCSKGEKWLSSNPAVNVLKTIGSSPMFLVMAILFSASILLAILSAANIGGSMSAMYDRLFDAMAAMGMDVGTMDEMVDLMGSTVNSSMTAGAVIGSIPSILIAVSLWMFYSTCRNRQTGNVSTAGLTICKVLTYISLVALCLGCIGVILIGVIGAVALGEYFSYEYYGYDTDVGAAITTVIIILVAVLLVVFVIALIYQVCAIKIINRIKQTALFGTPDNRIPSYFIVMNYVFAAGTIFSGLSSLGVSPFTALANCCEGAMMILLSLCLSRYRKEMTLQMYPPVQPVHAAQVPAQGYIPQAPAQPQVPAQQTVEAPVEHAEAAQPAEPQPEELETTQPVESQPEETVSQAEDEPKE